MSFIICIVIIGLLNNLVNSQSPCDTDLVLTEWQRSILYDTPPSESPISDDFIIDGWYKLRNEGDRIDIRMPTSSPGTFKCGTLFPVWIDDTYPALGDPMKSVTGCIDVSGDPCAFSVPISLLACSTVNNDLYFVHFFTDTPGTSMGYCTDSLLPCEGNLTASAIQFPPCNDNSSPVIECPTNITSNNYFGEGNGLIGVSTDERSPNATVTWDPPVTSGNGTVIVVSSSYESGDMIPIGIHTITFTATDSSGNIDTCDFGLQVVDNENPDLVCPPDITTTTSDGLNQAVNVTWTEPIVYDNSGEDATPTSKYNPGNNLFDIGSTDVIYDAVDSSGNVATCNFTVTVSDLESPDIINCPMNMTVNTTTGEAFAFNVTWVEPTATDNAGETPVPVADYTSGDNMFQIGDTTVQYNVSDSPGNYNERCSFVITVEDNERPMIECPKNITSNNYIGEDNGLVGVSTDEGSPNATVTWDPPLASDNINASVTVVSSPFESGDMIPIGTHAITFTATDSSGNIDTCELNIKIEDQEAPDIISCPMDMTVNTATGEVFAINVTWMEPTATDNSGEIIEVESNYTSGNIMFPIGDTTVQYNVSDSSGNFNDSCVFVITVEDNEDPVFNVCPNDTTVNTTTGLPTANVSWIEPTAMDNAGISIIIFTMAPGSIFPIGDNIVIYAAIDSNENFALCSFSITVEDNERPMIICPTNVTSNNYIGLDNGLVSVKTDEGSPNATVTWDPPLASDNSNETVTVVSSPYKSGDMIPIGIHPITFTANDSSGNFDTCDFTIKIEDNEEPILYTCPINDTTVNTTTGLPNANISWIESTVMDNSGIVITTGGLFPIGDNQIAYAVVGSNSIIVVCTFIITVEDNERPMITCPTNVTSNNYIGLDNGLVSVSTDEGSPNATVTWDPPVTSDNSNATVIVVSSPYKSGDMIPIGIHTITFTATDSSGNINTCDFGLNVEDSEAPYIINCQLDMTVNTTSGEAFAINVTWMEPTATDNSGKTPVPVADYTSGDNMFPIGSTTVRYNVSDSAGSFNEDCNFVVTVEDIERPVIDCPTNVTSNNYHQTSFGLLVISTDEGNSFATVTWNPPVTSDNSNGIVTVVSSPYKSGDMIPSGVHTITFTATDLTGNSDSCDLSFRVQGDFMFVTNIGPPGIYMSSIDSGDTTSLTFTAAIQKVQLTNPVAIDYDVTTSALYWSDVTTSSIEYYSFVTKQHKVLVSFETGGVYGLTIDGIGKKLYWTSTSEDRIEVINLDGTNRTVLFDMTLVEPRAIKIDTVNGYLYWTDWGLGNEMIERTQLNDVDATRTPLVTTGLIFPNGLVLSVSDGKMYWCDPGTNKIEEANLDGTNRRQVIDIGLTGQSPFAIDIYKNYLYWSDWTGGVYRGNRRTGISSIQSNDGRLNLPGGLYIFTDNVPSAIDCPTNVTSNNYIGEEFGLIQITTDEGSPTATVTWDSPVTSGNRTMTVVSSPYESGDMIPIGTHAITFTAIASFGNNETCDFYIKVEDQEAPDILNCPIDLTVNTTFGEAFAINIIWVEPTAVDNSGETPEPISYYNSSDNIFPIGYTTVQYNVSDSVGNFNASCSFVVTIEDNENPIIDNCPNDTFTTELQAAKLSWKEPAAMDNSGIWNLTVYMESNFSIGDNTVTYIAEDPSGNTATCSFTITVGDDNECDTDPCTKNEVCNNTIGSYTCECYTGFIRDGSNDCIDDNECDTDPCTENEVCNNTIGSFTCECDTGFARDGNNVCTDEDECANILCSENEVCNNTIGSFTCECDTGFARAGNNVCIDDNECDTDPCTENEVCNNTIGSFTCECDTGFARDGNNVCTDDNECDTNPCSENEVCNNTIGSYTCECDTGFIRAGNDQCIDFELPYFENCPESFTVGTDPGLATANVSWFEPVAIDINGINRTVQNYYPNQMYNISTYTLMYIAYDNSNNNATCEFVISVEDQEIPNINCPDNITTETDAGLDSALVAWKVPVPSDNVDILSTSPEPSPVISPPVNVPLTGNMAYVQTYTAEDTSGNIATCTFYIVVEDKEPPVITDCPLDMNLATSPGVNYTTAIWTEPIAEDNAGTPSLVPTHINGSRFYTGDTIVTYTAEDDFMNTATCNFTINVQDIEPPEVLSCPDNTTFSTDSGSPYKTNVNWELPTFQDNVPGSLDYSSNINPSSNTFQLGTTMVTYEATDTSMNTGYCIFYVTIIDDEPPVLECPGDIIDVATNISGISITWSDPTYTDNSAKTIILSSTRNSADVFTFGRHNVTYTGIDQSGNSGTCRFEITIEDKEPPVITDCPPDMNLKTSSGVNYTTATWTEPTTEDNARTPSLVTTHSNGSRFYTGDTIVTYTAEDDFMNTATCNFTITVQDIEPPEVLSCPDNTTFSTDSGSPYKTNVNWELPTFQDNVPGSLDYSSNINPSSNTFQLGTTMVTYEATDTSMNTGYCIFYITIIDDEPPVLQCPGDIIDVATNISGISIIWTDPTYTDNSGNTIILSSTRNSGHVFTFGIHNVTYTGIDQSGNSGTCGFEITIGDSCSSSPCQNGGTCVQLVANLTCICPVLYEGNLCQTIPGKPTAEIQLLSQSINLQSKVTFQCTVKNSVDWRWYKDDIELSSETRSLKNLTINEVGLENQGYYYCKAFGVSPHDDVTDTSMKAVLVVTDAFTVRVSVSFLNLQFTSGLTDSSSEEFKNTSTMIVNLLTESISISDIFVQVLSLSAGSVIADINIHTPSVDTTYDNFMNSLSEDFNTLANNGTIGQFSIFSTENCGLDIIEGLTFNRSEVGKNVSSEEVCPQSAVEYGMSLGFSICFSDGLSPAMWQDVMHRNCSEATSDQLLKRLSMMPITEDNAEEVLQAVNNITTTEPDTITPDGLEATAEIIESVISVNSTSSEVTSTLVDTVASLFEVDDDVLLESQMETQAPSRIVESLEEQLAVVDLENEKYEFITNTVAVQAQSLKSNEFDNMGIGIASYKSADSSVIVNLTGFIEPEELDNSASVASVSIYIPAIYILATSDGADLRVVTVVYNDSSLFPTNQFDTDTRRPNGQVISTSIPGVELKNLSDPIITTFIPAEISENNNETACVFWDFKLDDGNGGWSSAGCYLANGSLDGSDRQICHCDHLTNFAILMNFYSRDDTDGPPIVIVIARYITNIGLGISIACLLATIFTFTTNRKLRNSKPQQILCHLCVSLLGLYLVFLVGIDRTKKRRACTVIAGLIHYFLLTSIFWMSVQAIHMYYSFVKVYDAHISRFFLKACLFAWGIPVVIVAVTVGIDVDNYADTDYCFLVVTRMYYSVALPIAVILLTNVVVFIMVLHSLSKLGNVAKQAHKIRKKRKGMYLLQNAVCISVVMGMTWLIGFFAIGSASEIVQVLFCILNSFQGFFIFVMYCFRSKDIRKFWAEKTIKKLSSSFKGTKNSNLYSSGRKSSGFNSSASGRNQTHSDSRNYSNSNQVSFARSSRVSNDFSYRK
ncbi:uncharacterized protein [Antedon mediterranea]|uniref:uncharacterized protein n=1 Tax=Antedon mediterranea TaxID=105859 RepID=UPI003AF708A9